MALKEFCENVLKKSFQTIPKYLNCPSRTEELSINCLAF